MSSITARQPKAWPLYRSSRDHHATPIASRQSHPGSSSLWFRPGSCHLDGPRKPPSHPETHPVLQIYLLYPPCLVLRHCTEATKRSYNNRNSKTGMAITLSGGLSPLVGLLSHNKKLTRYATNLQTAKTPDSVITRPRLLTSKSALCRSFQFDESLSVDQIDPSFSRKVTSVVLLADPIRNEEITRGGALPVKFVRWFTAFTFSSCDDLRCW